MAAANSAGLRRTATIDYRVSRIPILCKDCRQDVGLYPARHVCNSTQDTPPLPIIDLSKLNITPKPQSTTAPPSSEQTTVSTTVEATVEVARATVGRGWDIVRNMNWKDMTKKEPESNGLRMWGKVLAATTQARQRVADKYWDLREGGNESDDDTPDNTHTQRVLAQYYMETEGVLPPWLTPPAGFLSSSNTGGSNRGTHSNASSISGSSGYRPANKSISLQDIYDSAETPENTQPKYGRFASQPDLYATESGTSSRSGLSGDRIRSKLRPTNARPSARPGSIGNEEQQSLPSRGGGGGGYSGRSGFGGGDGYDPYNYQTQEDYDYNRSQSQQRSGQYSGQYSSSGRPTQRR